MERRNKTIKFETQLAHFIHKEMEINKVFREGDAYYWGFQTAMEKVLEFTHQYKRNAQEPKCQLI